MPIGLTKSDSSVTLYSESTSQIKTAELTSIVDTYTYNIEFKDDSDLSTLSDGINFHYSYEDYRGIKKSGNISAVGTCSITVVYYKGESVPEVTLSNFESVNKEVNTNKESVDQFSYNDNNTGNPVLKTPESFNGTSQSQTDTLYFTKNWFKISISGQVLDTANNGVDNVAVSLDLASHSKITPSTTSSKSVYTDSEPAVGDGRRSGMFSGLGEDVVFFIDDPGIGVVEEEIKIVVGGKTDEVPLTINSNQSEYRVTIELN